MNTRETPGPAHRPPAPEIRVGTCGWHYRHWRGTFYPRSLAASGFLSFYAHHFRATEVNHTFYRLPHPDTVAHWSESTPEGFIFACKASRSITHWKKLKDPDVGIRRFLTRVEGLGPRLGPILFQLPPHWHRDPERLTAFLEALPAGHRFVLEFRDASWYVPEILELLNRHRVALCIHDFEGRRSPEAITGDFVYLRLHGPRQPYRGRYDGRTLQGWAQRIRQWNREGREVYCFFNNDQAGHAVFDAMRMRDMVAP